MAKKNYSIDELFGHFQLKKVRKCAVLKDWLSSNYTLKDYELQLLKAKRDLVENEGNYWNEEELKIRLLAILFEIAQIDEPNKVKVFFERSLSTTINKLYLSVKCDCLVAKPLGLNTPQTPYFFLQEFKKGKGDKLDPEAQMLTAMLIAQHLNLDFDS